MTMLWLGLIIYIGVTWYLVAKAIPDWQKIRACDHPSGKLGHVESHMRDKAEFLTWHCDKCPLQVHIRELVPAVWDDTFVYLRNGEKRHGEKHQRINRAMREYVRDTLEAERK